MSPLGPGFGVLAAAAGAAAGSFVATAAGRAARGQGWIAGRSRCDSCGVPVGFAQSVPLASWAMLGGRCAACREAISLAHPLGELLGALVAGLGVALLDPARAALVLCLALLALAVAVYDAQTQRIPDPLSLAIAVAAAGLAWLRGQDALIDGALCAVAVASALVLCRLAFSLLRRDPGLGLGDVKLLAASALWLGPDIFAALALAAAGGLVWARARRVGGSRRIAFGPFIAAAVVTVGLFGELS